MDPEGLVKKSVLIAAIDFYDAHELSGIHGDRLASGLWALAEAHKVHRHISRIARAFRRSSYNAKSTAISCVKQAFKSSSAPADKVEELPQEQPVLATGGAKPALTKKVLIKPVTIKKLQKVASPEVDVQTPPGVPDRIRKASAADILLHTTQGHVRILCSDS